MSRLQKLDKLMNDSDNQTYDEEGKRINMKQCPYQANLYTKIENKCSLFVSLRYTCSACPVDDKDLFNQLMEYIFHE